MWTAHVIVLRNTVYDGVMGWNILLHNPFLRKLVSLFLSDEAEFLSFTAPKTNIDAFYFL